MPDQAPATFVSSHGTTFTWNGNTYKCMDVTKEASAPSRERIDMTTLDVATNSEAVMRYAPIKPKRDPKKFTIAYRTMSDHVEIAEGDEYTLTTTGGSGTYRVTQTGTSRKVGQYVEGSATFEEVISAEVAS